ncbi:MAG: LysM peptidoglycan-binding domain-containing protein [Verrucomicrobiota bacterium]
MPRLIHIATALGILLFFATHAQGLTHKVAKGETLSAIAAKYGVTVYSIKVANKLSNANKISVGQTLEIPDKNAPSQKREYTVKRGDSLSNIAKAHGVTLDALKSENKISNANKIAVGQKLIIPGEAQPYSEYKVRNGDSLSSIASRYGVKTSDISKINGIRNSNKIRVGQILKIPGKHLSETSPHPPLPSSVRASLNKISVTGKWKNIVIHHSATRRDSAKSMDRYHREERRMENGLAYHFVIGNGSRGMGDGEIYIGERWQKQIQGGHLKSILLNRISIGICLIGNFETHRPSKRQMEQLEALVAYLLDKTNMADSGLTSHKLIHPNHTVCPGKYFPIQTLQSKF